MIKHKKLIIICLTAVPLTMVLGNSMLLPELPYLASVLEVTQLQIGLLISSFSFSGGLAIPLLGYLSDKYNRKKILLSSLIIYGSGGIIAGLLALIASPKYYNYILGARIIQGIGAGGTYPLAIALTGDIFAKQERNQALGSLEAANAGGKVISPFLGAFIALLFWPGLFFIYPLLTFPLALMLYYFIPASQPATITISFKDYLTQLIDIIAEQKYKFFVCLATAVVALFIFFGVLSFVSKTLTATYNIIGLTRASLIALPILSLVITAHLIGRYLKLNKPALNLLLSGGLVLNAIALLTLPFIDGLILYLALIACLGIGNGIILTVLNTIFASSSTETYRGGLSSIYGSMRFLGIALGPPAFAILNQISTLTMFIVPAGLAMLLSLMSLLL